MERWGNSESEGGDFSKDGILNYLQNKAGKNLDYLKEEGVNYDIRVLNQLE